MSSKIQDAFPLSPTQEGMLFHSVSAGGEGLYVELTTFRVRGELDLAAFERAWQELAHRHAALRSGFAWERIAAPHQVVLESAELPVEVVDLRDAGPQERADAVAAHTDRLRTYRFDLTRPPLMRVAVLRLPDEHLVVWSYHHLLLDGWSASLLLAELVQAVGGRELPAVPPTAPARRYVTWLRGLDPAPASAFWAEYLAGYAEPAALTLPEVRPGARPSGEFRAVGFTLPAEQVGALRAAASAARTTVGCLVEAAWGLTLARYSGRDDVVFGVTASARPVDFPDAYRLVGTFINTIPVRLRTEATLAEFAAGRQRALDHVHTPLTDIRRHSGFSGSVALFDTVVVFENYPDDTAALLRDGTVRVDDVRYETRTNYQVTLVVRVDTTLTVQAIVDDRQFAEGEPEALLAFFRLVLDRLRAGGTSALSELTALPGQEQDRLVREWNDTDDPGAVAVLLPGLLAATLSERPEHPAVSDDETTLTYRELEERATALAHRLVRSGVRPGDRVGVCHHRSAELVVTLLGIAKAGAAFVPLDPAYPAERLGYVANHAELRLVVADEGAAAVAEQLGVPLLSPGPAEPVALPPVAAADLAYVIYTSGSTGVPKGVAVSHGALANLVSSLATRWPGLTPADRFLALTTLSFDTSLAELLVPLLAGATVLIGGTRVGMDGRELDRYVAAHKVTALQATPSRFRVLIDSGWQGSPRIRLYSCGEAFPADLVTPLTARGESVWNMYGPTETTVYSSVSRIDPDTTRVRVGRPIANTRLYVLDQHQQPVPVGVVGELYIGGVGVAEGYWRNPELTAQRFLPDPFVADGRVYRTGDLARIWADGELEILGRSDRQIKLRGYRIEPGEIEQVLLRHDDVHAAAVTVHEARQLAAYVTAPAGVTVDAEDLGRHLRRFLPGYMVPDALVVLDEMPLTPSGKTDVLALPAPQAAPEATGAAGDDDYEAVLLRHCRAVLGVAEVNPEADFFDIGGDSLRGLRLVARVQEELGITIDPESLFDFPTVRSLAQELARQRREAAGE
ncbi:amino acid adenylation domain-containing protein [Micromonospora sp. NPDC000089]|uniref:non-ribosomal peptide synthetase n=1 Tax=unclassified Micromonospora TaxID=2617518 RepID=UPI0036BB90BA